MKRFRRLSTLIVLALLVATGFPQVFAQKNVIYLVRHGDTPQDYDNNPDPDLIPAGKKRAEDLALLLRAAGITRVYSTNYVRTKATAAPIAKALGIDVEIYNPREGDAFVRQLRSEPGVHLVVGHSNTTPDFVKRLGGEPGVAIQHTEFDRLYALVFDSPDGSPVTLSLRFGAEFKEH